MRTAEDFNLYYATPDPWQISRARFRDRVLRQCLKRFIRGKSVLELGCGEGHLSSVIPCAAIERPACPKCKAAMKLANIKPACAGVDLHTFECAICNLLRPLPPTRIP